MAEKLAGVSNEAVKKGTGKGWGEWIKLLDKEGAGKMTHKEIAKLIYDKRYIKKPKEWPARFAARRASRSFSVGWWSQMVTVGYEYAKGRRIKGQTESVGFEIGVQKMLLASPQRVWRLINSKRGKDIWVGDAETETRTIKPYERIRLLWKAKEWDTPSTLQVSLFCPRNTREKTNLRFHQEKLKSAIIREQMRKRWKKVLEDISRNL